MKKFLVMAVVLVTLVCASFADTKLSLYSNVAGNGGIRADLGQITVDGVATLTGSTYSYSIDAFSGPFGLVLGGNDVTTLKTISLAYRVEQKVTDKLSFGISVPLVTSTSGVSNWTIIGNCNFYGVLAL